MSGAAHKAASPVPPNRPVGVMSLFDPHKIVLSGAPWEWTAEGQLRCVERPSVLLWLNPSMYHLLSPLIAEIGPELASLLIAYDSSLGTEADYTTMVTVLGNTFSEGFLAWGRAVTRCGWGRFELTHFDPDAKLATVRVHDPWELAMQEGTSNSGWGCPFLRGKVIGLFSHALGTRCWADERIVRGESNLVEFSIYASDLTIEGEIAALRAQRQKQKEEELIRVIEQRVYGLRQNELQLRTMLRNAPSVIFSIDSNGDFLLSEGAQLSALGLTPGQVVGTSAFQLYKDDPESIRNLQAVLRGEERTWRSQIGRMQFECIVRPLRNEQGTLSGAFGICTDVTKLVETEQQLLQVQQRLQQELSEKQQTILLLSTPVVRLWDGILLLPLVGSIDGPRGQQLMQTLLESIAQNHANHVIIDITGVPFVDTQVANYLIKTVHAARLLGVSCMLVGISAEVAQTLVQIGADLSQVNTYANLESGLKVALSHVPSGSQAVRSPRPRPLR